MPETVVMTELTRMFKHDGRYYPDPAPSQPPEKCVEILSLTESKFNNAVVEPPKVEGSNLVYPIKVSVGTKG